MTLWMLAKRYRLDLHSMFGASKPVLLGCVCSGIVSVTPSKIWIDLLVSFSHAYLISYLSDSVCTLSSLFQKL